MENEDKKIYFSDKALAMMTAAQGKSVEKVICHLWHNTFDRTATVEIIDNVELHFTDGHKLTVACNEQGDGLDIITFDYKRSAVELNKEFEGKIKLLSVNASGTTMWEAVIGKQLEKVRVTRREGYHLADSLVLDFGEEKREISIAPLDGLIIDYYEED